jgi:hypothetical protein
MTTARNLVDGSEKREPMPNQKAPIHLRKDRGHGRDGLGWGEDRLAYPIQLGQRVNYSRRSEFFLASPA